MQVSRSQNPTFVDTVTGGGLLSAEYRFSSSTVAADPGVGRFRFDTADYSTVTEIFIDDVTDNGVDISNLLALISAGDRLYFQVKSEANKFVIFDVIGVAVDNTGWFTIPVEEVLSGDFFGNLNKCLMIWSVGGANLLPDLDTRGISVETPVVDDNFTIFFTDVEITIQQINFVLQGSTDVTVFVNFDSDRSAAGTSVITAGTVVSNTTTGQEITSFDEAVIPAGSWVWVEFTAVTLNPDEVNVSLVYR
jgi:hypothetical protein